MAQPSITQQGGHDGVFGPRKARNSRHQKGEQSEFMRLGLRTASGADSPRKLI